MTAGLDKKHECIPGLFVVRYAVSTGEDWSEWAKTG